MALKWFAVALLAVVSSLRANPFYDEAAVPKDPPFSSTKTISDFPVVIPKDSAEVVRVELEWDSATDIFHVANVVRELSGTPALLKRASFPDPIGSYRGELVDRASGKTIAYASLGTGSQYRNFARGLSFRFPVPAGEVDFYLIAENPTSGKMERVLTQPITIPMAIATAFVPTEIRQIRKAKVTPSVKVVYYAEGYVSESGKEAFFQTADRATNVLEKNNWPGFERMDFSAVFATSKMALGKATTLGIPVLERDSFLGLYFPYWTSFPRWDFIVYATRESRLRENLARAPYDYPIVIAQNQNYWGIGNFNYITAIPSDSTSFSYLMLHEFGHFFGLNEEYNSGGTELEFASRIEEPWSQNMTFLPKSPKWINLIASSTPLPTPASSWNANQGGPIGSYRGGYANADLRNHKPAIGCVMETGSKFCKVCEKAIRDRVTHDLGEAPLKISTQLAHQH